MEQTASNSSNPGTEDMDVGGLSVEDFIASGRTGRRNAMPDILDSQHAAVGTGGLAEGMEKLNCSDSSKGGDSSQNTQNPSSSQGS
ncbi:cAMP-dependent protein kinase inhibitor alpha-like [Mercenaria mercenaria]|uniref:cAMP-dependent protein kinase inhibitor alpha-like n=1 Tax=Mercenaria mercenaria TaxID=6596 RepID=UPI001E1DF5E6|nr:cAMP-dependent protein kinase inhibitor alpha-like [Mercenaria mercenaria]XP_045181821.1 cAMP-dependent protein kinase inhibitor alpha-like [Mercenaria mercenaria]XP_045181822.1 cAMP-dependent protein kinase inhibitor alpha-like [Mercenaria mercenaria]XP_045181824.1 cAMP-dependent protein kinase inhibitor alpha-like [Mercenaria mercenaria]